MRRLYQILLVCMILLPGMSIAQEAQTQAPSPASQEFTLEQCIQYALENSVNVKNAAIDEDIAKAKVRETRGIGLPQISGSVAVQHNEKLPRFFTQYVEGQEGFIDLSGQGLQSGDVVAVTNFFQLKSIGSAEVTINQILFNGSYIVGLKAASTYRELSEKSARQTKEETIEKVTKAYYAVLINKDRMQLFDNNIARVDSLLATTRALNQNGFAEAIDVDRIQVTLNNLKAERNKFYNLQEVATQLLKFQMNFPIKDTLNVIGDMASLSVDENVLNEYTANWDYTARVDYSMLETNRDLLSLNLKNRYAESLPSLVAFGNLGYQTQSPNISGVFKTNTNLGDNGFIGPDRWYQTMSFGVSLQVPIFSGLQRTYKVQQARLELQKIENSFTMMKSAIDVEIKSTAIIYLNAVQTMKSQQANKDLAENVARVTKIKYEQGVGSNIEVIDAETSLREAQINYYGALYDALVAKVDLDKAYGRLNPQPTENK